MGNAKDQYEKELERVERLIEKHERQKALPLATRAIELNTNDARGYILRSECHRPTDYENSLADIDKAIELDPTNGQAFFQRGLLNWSADPSQARGDLEKAVELGCEQAQCSLLMLNIDKFNYGFEGEEYAEYLWEEAEREEDDLVATNFLSRAIEALPTRPAFYWCRASRYEKAGHYDLAVEDYSKAIELDEKWIVAYISRGRAYRAIGNKIEAERDFDKALSIEPRNQEHDLLERCYIQLERENYNEAIKDARRVNRTYNASVECYIVTGFAFTKLGLLENAAEEYTDALQNSVVADHPRFLKLRAEIYDKLNRTADAENDRQVASSILNVTH